MSVDEKTLREFMERHYPKYANNLALARILYARHKGMLVGEIPLVNSTVLRDYVGARVRIRGVLASYRVIEYEACPKCRFSVKKCRCEEKSTPEKRFTYEMVVGDEYDNFKALAWMSADGWLSMDDVGKEVEIIGTVALDEEDNRPRVEVKKLEIKSEPSISDNEKHFLSVLREAKSVRVDIFENLAKVYEVDVSRLQAYFRREGDYVVWTGEAKKE
jgi:hypothetical protein